MPVSVSRDPFASAPPARGTGRLLTPQARVLAVLVPPYPEDPVSMWPLATRARLAASVGYKSTSGTMTRALNGIREGNRKSGDPHPGLVDLGLVEAVEVDVDGVVETNYRITPAGLAVLRAHIAAVGELPRVRDAAASTNSRYRR